METKVTAVDESNRGFQKLIRHLIYPCLGTIHKHHIEAKKYLNIAQPDFAYLQSKSQKIAQFEYHSFSLQSTSFRAKLQSTNLQGFALKKYSLQAIWG